MSIMGRLSYCYRTGSCEELRVFDKPWTWYAVLKGTLRMMAYHGHGITTFAAYPGHSSCEINTPEWR